jgi:hypothetical protein
MTWLSERSKKEEEMAKIRSPERERERDDRLRQILQRQQSMAAAL